MLFLWCAEGIQLYYFSMEKHLGVKAPRQLSFCAWTATWGTILIGDDLRRMGVIIVDWCCLCQCSGENVIISCFIMGRFPSYGVLLLDRLALLGFYQRGLLIYWQDGGTAQGSTDQIFGIQYHNVSCGLFGESVMLVNSKIQSTLGISSQLYLQGSI